MSRQGVMNGPFKPIKSAGDSGSLKAGSSRPFRECFRFSKCGDYAISSSVVGLLNFFRPSNIPWLIVAFIVDAVYRHLARWTLSDICQEVFKTFQPSIANANSSSSIVFEVFCFRVEAPRLQMPPCSIFWRPFVSGSVPVRAMQNLVDFRAKAPARCAFTGAKVSVLDYFHGPTQTFTHASTIAIFGCHDRDNGPSSKNRPYRNGYFRRLHCSMLQRFDPIPWRLVDAYVDLRVGAS